MTLLTLGRSPFVLVALLCPSPGTELEQGVVVASVTHSYAGQAAGLQPGDVVQSWFRDANPPSNPSPAGGSIQTPFDLEEIETEQAPRGQVTLVGLRGRTPSSWVLPPNEWRLKTRPMLSGPLNELYAEGLQLVSAKRLREGTDRWRMAAETAKRDAHPVLASWLSLEAAEVLSMARSFASADEFYAEAHGTLETLQLPAFQAQALRAWGMSFRHRNGWDQARRRFEEALECEQARNAVSLAVARTEHHLARTAFWNGRMADSDGHYGRALALQGELGPNSHVIANTLSDRADVERGRDLDKAHEYITRALSIRRKTAPESVGFSIDLTQLGWIAYARGDLIAASNAFDAAQQQLEKLAPEGTEVPYNLVGVANVQFRQGDLAASEGTYRRALDLWERLNPEAAGVGSVYLGLGTVALRRQDLDIARSHYLRAVAILEKFQSSRDYTRALHQLGEVELERRDWQMAESYFRQALAINERQRRDSEPTAYDLVGIARALAGQGRFNAARETAEHALDTLRRLMVPGSLEISHGLDVVADTALASGDLLAALKGYEESLAIRSRLVPNTDLEAESQFGIALVYRKTGRLSDSDEALSQALSALEQQGYRLGGTQEARASFGARYANYYREYIELLLEMGRTEEAFKVLERSRARTLLAMLADRVTLRNSDLTVELAEQQRSNHLAYDQVQYGLVHLKPGRDDAGIEQLRSRLRELRDEAERIAARVRRTSARASALHYPEPLGLRDARAALDSGSTLLAYSVGERDTTLFAMSAPDAHGGELKVFTVPVGRELLREKVAAFRSKIEGDSPGELAAAAELYNLLVRPAELLLVESRRLVISPDDVLHLLPFSALVRAVRPTAQYLIEWKPIHIVASATVYAELKKRRSEIPSRRRQTLAAFGDPRYPSLVPELEEKKDPELRRLAERGISLSPLPSTRAEVQGIAALYASARMFLGDQATEEQVKSVAKDITYLHIASHAVLDESLPLNSGLALSPPHKPGLNADNGLLQAWEIFDTLRMDSEMVTLSACKTALGIDMAGDGLLGLTRAFQYAGARTVVASLWSVADRSTAKLMRHFYGHLVSGKSKDEALRSAQIELLRSRGPAARPRHWAPFQLFGDWQ